MEKREREKGGKRGERSEHKTSPAVREVSY
jgi:hypothetical protein